MRRKAGESAGASGRRRALAAGCTLVAKPPHETPLAIGLIVRCFADAGLPAGVLNDLPGTGPEAGAALAAHPRVRMMTATASTAAGQSIMRAAADTMKRLLLELGDIQIERKTPILSNEFVASLLVAFLEFLVTMLSTLVGATLPAKNFALAANNLRKLDDLFYDIVLHIKDPDVFSKATERLSDIAEKMIEESIVDLHH